MIARLRQLIGPLLRRLAGPDPEREAAFRRKLTSLREEVVAARSRATQRAAALDRHKRQILDLKRRLAVRTAALARKAEVFRRQSPSVGTAAAVLALRVRTGIVPCDERELIRGRHDAWLEMSPTYRAAIMTAATDAGDCDVVSMDGIAWHVPRTADGRDASAHLRRRGVPLRMILQARDVGVGGIMIDVGANIGLTSVPRVLLGDVRLVYALEPEPRNFACLVRTIHAHRLEGMILPDQVAVGSTRRRGVLQRSHAFGAHRVLPDGEHDADAIAVESWTLDEWVASRRIEIEALTFVKIDAQGAELDILRGADALLRRPHVAWQLEIQPGLLRAAGGSAEELFALLESRFSTFVDIGTDRPGPREQPIYRIREALAYLDVQKPKTDVLVYGPPGAPGTI